MYRTLYRCVNRQVRIGGTFNCPIWNNEAAMSWNFFASAKLMWRADGDFADDESRRRASQSHEASTAMQVLHFDMGMEGRSSISDSFLSGVT
jgi:hypothetical protein